MIVIMITLFLSLSRSRAHSAVRGMLCLVHRVVWTVGIVLLFLNGMWLLRMWVPIPGFKNRTIEAKSVSWNLLCGSVSLIAGAGEVAVYGPRLQCFILAAAGMNRRRRTTRTGRPQAIFIYVCVTLRLP
jgi:hypothetical protein